MARAKRTDRAEARRRYRAQLVESGQIDGDDVETDAGEAAPATRPMRARGATGRPDAALRQERPAPAGGIRAAFTQAFRPLNLREDLRLLPRLLANKAFWLPVLFAAVTAGAVIAFQGRELISAFALTYFVYPPPLGAVFLAGFLAPRASYLIAGLVGAVTAFLLAFVVQSVPSLSPGAGFGEALFAGLATSPMSGIFFGAAAAWYRRFLYLASPARRMAPPPRSKQARGR